MTTDLVSEVEIDVPSLNLPFWNESSQAIYDSFRWIERKVETFSFDVDIGSTRRHSSYDMWIPKCFKKLGWLPVTNFKKEDLRDLDVRDGSENSLSTLTKTDNARLGVALLFSGLETKNQNSVNERKLWEIVEFNPTTGSKLDRDTLLSGYSALTSHANKDIYRFLSELLIDAFILWIQLPPDLKSDLKSEHRLIVKITHEYDLASPIKKNGIKSGSNQLRRIDINTRMCGSYHLEVRAPLGQLVSRLQIISVINGKDYEHRTDTKTPTQVAHTTSPGKNTNPDQYAIFSILRRRSNFELLALLTTFCLTSFLLLAVLNFYVDRYWKFNLVRGDANSLGTTILLVGPAVIMLFLASQPEHRLVASLVRMGKVALYTSAGILITIAALLSGILDESHLWEKRSAWVIWAICLISSSVTTWKTTRWFYSATILEKNK